MEAEMNGSGGGEQKSMASLSVEPTSLQGENSEFYTASSDTIVASASDGLPSSSSSAYHSSRIDAVRESMREHQSAVDFDIAASRSHWTELDLDDDTEYSPEDDLNYFSYLKANKYSWGYQHNRKSTTLEGRNVVVGEKIAQGGQAEIYEAQVAGDSRLFVVKVFNEGYSLRSLQRQWPRGMVAHWTHHITRSDFVYPHYCKAVGYRWATSMGTIKGAMMLKDERFNNRFAFLMERAWGDLRKHIDLRMLHRKNNRGPPYSTEEVKYLMHAIAQGMMNLQRHEILHRDLKASNVLLLSSRFGSKPWTAENLGSRLGDDICIADFESSVGVVGTGFWRAPEILQQLKDRVSMINVVFTSQADVYSYGMTCYEIVTGLTPFEGVPWRNYDIVLSGKQQTLPHDLDPVVRDIIISCWQLDPLRRPSFKWLKEKLSPYHRIDTVIIASCLSITRT